MKSMEWCKLNHNSFIVFSIMLHHKYEKLIMLGLHLGREFFSQTSSHGFNFPFFSLNKTSTSRLKIGIGSTSKVRWAMFSTP